jgi:type IX secretion system PorP/SprF family membrane protein
MKRIILFSIILALAFTESSKAQLNPLIAQYFNNPYLGNPSFAGIDSGFNIGISYRKLWNNIPGSPELQGFIADYGHKRAGFGLNIGFDKAGLQRQSRVVGTYAYHLPISGNKKQLHFGLSLGFMNQRLSGSDVVGNGNDPLAVAYNERQTYIDGDFGIAFTGNRFKIEASIPNLNSFFKRSDIKLADIPTFYTAMSYKLGLSGGRDGVALEPKLAYRGVKGFDNMVDLGTNITLANDQIMLMAIYHSSKNASFGFGIDYKQKYFISGAYTTQTSALSSYANGSFEISLKLHLGK